MAPTTALSERAKVVLDYHRNVPNNDPRFVSWLIGRSCVKSLAELDATYDELEEAGYLEPVCLGSITDQKTGEELIRPFFQCRLPVRW
jgi:hypothetical protein